MIDASLVIVLAEDMMQQRFVLQYLKKLNFTGKRVRSILLPGGKRCGEQFVRENYAKEVRAFRSRSANASTVLIVTIDADTSDVARRHTQLTQALAECDLPSSTQYDRGIAAHKTRYPSLDISLWDEVHNAAIMLCAARQVTFGQGLRELLFTSFYIASVRINCHYKHGRSFR